MLRMMWNVQKSDLEEISSVRARVRVCARVRSKSENGQFFSYRGLHIEPF